MNGFQPAVSFEDSGRRMKSLENIKDGDVVILPAFGAALEEMRELDKKNVQVIDTTCPWVSKVWNTVDKHTKVRSSFAELPLGKQDRVSPGAVLVRLLYSCLPVR